MKTFLQWVEDKGLELPEFKTITNAEEGEEVENTARDTTDENRERTGCSPLYPDAYVKAQYPHKYFNPSKSTADLDLKDKKK